MKLYSIMILFKDKETGKARTLSSASELSSFSFFYKKNVGVGSSYLLQTVCSLGIHAVH